MQERRVGKGGRPKGQMSTRVERLRPEHFRLLSAVMQGVSPEAAWNQYMGMEDEPRRGVPARVLELAGQVVSAAKAAGKEATGKEALDLLISRLEGTLRSGRSRADEGIEYEDPEPESEADRAKHYGWGESDRDGDSAPLAAMRLVQRTVGGSGSVLDRRVKSLLSLRDTLTNPPGPNDGLASWMPAELVKKLKSAPATAGATTLPSLIRFMNESGFGWWTKVPGVGKSRGERLTGWIWTEARKMGVRLEPHVLRSAARTAIESQGSQVEKGQFSRLWMMLLPQELNGATGSNRGKEEHAIGARDDADAVRRLLRQGRLSAGSERASTRAIERLFNWLLKVRLKALSEISAEDVDLYRAFLMNVPKEWIEHPNKKRREQGWMPFRAQPIVSSVAVELRLIAAVMQGLVKEGYLKANPVRGASVGLTSRKAQEEPSTTLADRGAPSESQLGIREMRLIRAEAARGRQDRQGRRALLVVELLRTFRCSVEELVKIREWKTKQEGGRTTLWVGEKAQYEIEAETSELIERCEVDRRAAGIDSPYLIAQVSKGVPAWKSDGRGGAKLVIPGGVTRGPVKAARARSWARNLADRCCADLDSKETEAEGAALIRKWAKATVG